MSGHDVSAFKAADLHPHGAMERFFWAGQALPGALGYICFRKMKRRAEHRAENRFAQLAAALGPGDIALDLGANVGDMTALLAAGGAEVHAFEPEPETFALLATRFGGDAHVHLHQAAVADYEGTADLVLPASFRDQPRSASKAASIAHDRYRQEGHLTHQVRVADIRTVLAGLRAAPRIIKMDIEGAELDILDALRADRVLTEETAVFVETHERLDLTTLPRVRALQAWARSEARAYVNLYWS